MKSSKPHIYIPIEIFYREINSRILLATTACLKGYRVYIGTKSGIDQILNNKKIVNHYLTSVVHLFFRNAFLYFDNHKLH